MLTFLLLLVLAPDWPTVIKPVSDQVVRIEIQITTAEDNDVGFCSGVVLDADRGFVLTAQHCVRRLPADAISIAVNGRHADVVRENRVLDLAILHFDAKKERAMALAAETPPVGAEIALVGHAYGAKPQYVQVGRVALQLDDEGRFVVDLTTIKGDSGCPIINDRGELVGLTSQINVAGGYLGSAVPLETIRAFVKSYLPEKK